MRKRILSYVRAVIFVLSMTMFATGITANAASTKTVKKVTVRVDKKNITKKTYTLEIGKSKSLKVTASPKGAVKTIRYQSSNPRIVAVSKKGKITAKKKGTAKIQITVTGKNNKKKSTWVKIKAINPTVKSISICVDNEIVTQNTYTMESGSKKSLKVSVIPENSVKTVHYQSGDTGIVSVDKDGMVTAEKAGTARVTVTVTNKDNKKKSAWVEIRVIESKSDPQPDPAPVSTPDPIPDSGTSNILIAYFSHAGNTEYPDNVDATTSASIVVNDAEQYGTTEYLARMIQQKVGGDLHRIETKEAYPSDFNEVVDQNHTEMQNGILPELKESNIDISRYDTVFIGYPVWAANAPQAVLSFLKEYDLSGKTVIPFCTHDGYGAGSSYRTIGNACPQATVLDGLAVLESDVPAAENTVENWLASMGITEPEEGDGDLPEKNRILVVYFSATNTTERLAGFIADGLPADLYEIVPEIPYTSADLNYGDSSSRTSIEMNDPNARPAISDSVEDMGQYDTIFLGYPIWWAEAPRIINTFLESYDFSGKTIIPFCTSGSSGIGSSATHLHSLTDGAKWLSDRRFGGSASRDDMITWVNDLGLGFTAE